MGPGLLGYTIRRVLWAIPVLFVISFLVFAMLRLAPGDPVDTILGQRYDEDEAARLRAKYGYDEPLIQQYVTYMGNLAKGDLGVSTRRRDFDVSEIVWPRIWVSTRLGLMALAISFGLGIPMGIYAALARGTFLDPLIIGSWLLLDAIPTIVLIPVVTWFFALKLGIVDLSYRGLASPNILPAILILGLTGVAGVARFMRASILQAAAEDYVRTARAKGLPERIVIVRHVTRNAMLPMVTVIGLSLPGVAAGSLFIERFFGIPGIGNEAIEAVLGPDYDVILALVLFSSVLFVFANVVIDIAYAMIDPRIRLGAERNAS